MEKIKSEVKEKSMSQKLADKEISFTDYRNYIAQQKGFANNQELLDCAARQKGYKNHREYMRKYRDLLANKFGFVNSRKYTDYLAKQKGYKGIVDYAKHTNYKSGRSRPCSENKQCPSYLGVYIAERLLSNIFVNVQRMPNNNPGFDFICGKGYKINVKSSCLDRKENRWFFNIHKNKIPEYFLLLAFDNRNDLNPQYIWLIKSTEMIYNRMKTSKQLNDKVILTITNNLKNREFFSQFEQTDKLEKLVSCCNVLKDKHLHQSA